MQLRFKQPVNQMRAANFAPESWDAESRTLEMTWTTGARVLRQPWYGKAYEEELSLEADHVRLERLNKGAPLLSAHSSWSNRTVIGVIVAGSARIEDGVGKATVRLSEAESAADDVFKILEGILRNVSVGYQVYSYERTEHLDQPDVLRAIDWEPHEISIVPIPADVDAQLRAQNSHLSAPVPAHLVSDPQERDMPAEKKPQVVSVDDAKAQAATARTEERKRISDIRGAARKLDIDAEGELVEGLINGDVSTAEARAKLIDAHADHIERNVPTQDNKHTASIGNDEQDTRAAAMGEALLHRSNPERTIGDKTVGFPLTERAQVYRFDTLLDHARACVEASGVRTRGMSKHDIVTRALKTRGAIATTDFTDLTVSTARRNVRSGYAMAPANYQQLAERRRAPDFKSTKELIYGGLGLPKAIAEGGEFKHAAEVIGGKSWALSTSGHKMALTLQAIINDDLDAFGNRAVKFGAASRRFENKEFFDLLLSNPTVYDEAAMFSDARGNVIKGGSAGDPSKAQYALMRAILGKQTGLDADEDLELEMRYLVGGIDQMTNMESMTLQTTPATTANAIPQAFRSYQPVSSARIDRTDGDLYFGCADPGQVAAFIYATLDGMENGPAVEEKELFDTLGIGVRSYNFFAVAAIDFRGWVINDQNNTLIA